MDKEYTKGFNNITYADLSQMEMEKLKEVERIFNNEFHRDYYLMVMRNHNIKS